MIMASKTLTNIKVDYPYYAFSDISAQMTITAVTSTTEAGEEQTPAYVDVTFPKGAVTGGAVRYWFSADGLVRVPFGDIVKACLGEIPADGLTDFGGVQMEFAFSTDLGDETDGLTIPARHGGIPFDFGLGSVPPSLVPQIGSNIYMTYYGAGNDYSTGVISDVRLEYREGSGEWAKYSNATVNPLGGARVVFPAVSDYAGRAWRVAGYNSGGKLYSVIWSGRIVDMLSACKESAALVWTSPAGEPKTWVFDVRSVTRKTAETVEYLGGAGSYGGSCYRKQTAYDYTAEVSVDVKNDAEERWFGDFAVCRRIRIVRLGGSGVTIFAFWGAEDLTGVIAGDYTRTISPEGRTLTWTLKFMRIRQ